MSAHDIISLWKDAYATDNAQAPMNPIGSIATEEGFIRITGGSSVATDSGYTTCETRGPKCTFIGECCF